MSTGAGAEAGTYLYNDVSVGATSDSVGCEPGSEEHTDYDGAFSEQLLNFCTLDIVTKTTWGLDNNNNMWTFLLREWVILSASGECFPPSCFLKDKYPVRTKCFVVSQPDNIC